MFELKIASNAQRVHADTMMYEEWGKPDLTIEQYFERERALYATEFDKRTLSVYVLVPTESPETLDILAYVEVYKRPCIYDGRLLHAYSLDAVFTPPQVRGKGYATIMLQELVSLLHSKGPDGVVISNLYSDIGPSFYANRGWTLFPSDQLIFPSTMETSPCDVNHISLRTIDSPTSLEHVCQEDLNQMQSQAATTPLSVFFILEPSLSQWFQVRSHFYARAKTNFSTAPQSMGVFSINEGETASDYVFWTHDFEHDELAILRCRTTETVFPFILNAALAEAKSLQQMED
ncbi:hypothetical protein Ae201684P_010204 [Aphanomyces euteiches]|nr:hypothetical protein Ae201684P_010204 [Aphanomyces euteiches]KAH9143918.1 hypothetical protein AeRB84_012102 [Aphanomyces euteiches]